MKIRIEAEEAISEPEIVIRCKELNEKVLDIQKEISDVVNSYEKMVLYKNDVEFYISVNEILFYKTDGNVIAAHTKDKVYHTKMRLYELEDMLPSYFMRISKSAVCNINKIYALDKSITSVCTVQFYDTSKQVYVSRHYYKALRDRIEEKRRHL